MTNIFKLKGFRWRILFFLFAATTINYIDRQAIGLLAPLLKNEIGWTESDYGFIVSFFELAYAIGLTFSGYVLDKLGTKKGFGIAVSLWSVSSMLHSAARSVAGFASMRFMLGLGESANFPACVKAVSEWFPQKERSLATGLFNAGSAVGAILGPIIVPFAAAYLGWRWTFVVVGSLGSIWALFWFRFYRAPKEHPKLSEKERAYIEEGQTESQGESVSWFKLLKHKETYALCAGRFITDPVWWFFLFWLPKFLEKQHGLNLKEMALPIVVIYLMADTGSIGGGWLSSFFMSRGKSADYARKTTILIGALLVTPIFFVSQTGNIFLAVGLIGLATAAHQSWAANIFTVVSDLYPKKAVGSMIGLTGTAGALGGALAASAVGLILEATESYALIFALFSGMYLLAWLILKIFIPKIKPIDMGG